MHADGLVCIGKEAHRLDERDLVASLDELQSVYHDPRREPWMVVAMLPKLRALAAQPEDLTAMREVSGLLPRALRDVLTGRSRPREAAARITLAALVHDGAVTPERHYAGCGEPLTTPTPRQRYCSESCRKRSEYQRRCARQRT